MRTWFPAWLFEAGLRKGFHLDDESLDPKTWCRFPILSGNFERELAALRAHVGRERP